LECVPAKDGCPPRVDPRCRHERQIYPLPQKEQHVSVGSIMVAKIMLSAVPASSRRVGSREKLLLNDLKIGFD